MGFTTAKATDILRSAITGAHYVGLSTTKPNENGTGYSEPSPAAGYERVQLGSLDYTQKEAQVANEGIIFFNETLDSWGTITHFMLFDSKSATTPYFWGELTTPVPIQVTDDNTYVPIFRAYALIIGLDKAALDTDYKKG